MSAFEQRGSLLGNRQDEHKGGAVKIETVQRPLRDVVRAFTEGKVLLPQFQRDYVWKPKKIRNLLDSLLQEYPIGGFYLWRPTGGAIDPKPTRFGDGRISPEFWGYLIDGQQRLTSLEAAYGLYSGEDRGGQELRCYLDLTATDVVRRRDTRLFVSYGGHRAIRKRIDVADPTLVAVSELFDELDTSANYEQEQLLREHLKSLAWSSKRVEDALRRLDKARRMLDQQVPCTTVREISDAEAVEVFSRLNKGGTPLKQADVTAAGLARGSAVNVLRAMREFASRDRPRRLGFGFSFAFRALVVFHRGSAQLSSLKEDWMDTPGPDGRSLLQSWKAAERGVEAALQFADAELGWSRRLLLPSTNALIVLAVALDRSDFKVGPDDQRMLRRWLCLTALRGVFHGSVETTMKRFLKGMAESRRRPAAALVDSLRRHEGRAIRADELQQTSPLWGAAVQLLHGYSVHRDARDWLDIERSVDSLARADAAKYPGGDLTVHHIFPRKLLTELGLEADAVNRPANFALISRSTNAEFGDREPEDVLGTLTPGQRKEAAKQFFGADAGDRLRRTEYEKFCEWRAGKLADALNDFLGLE
jgi:hypothetical protein